MTHKVSTARVGVCSCGEDAPDKVAIAHVGVCSCGCGISDNVLAAGDAGFSNVAVSATAGGGGVWVSGGIIAGAGALLVAMVWR